MLDRIKEFLGGHVTLGPITVYGFNAMHLSISISTDWGYACFHPGWGRWPWYVYLSPNATPWASTFAKGPGIDAEQILLAPLRRVLFGYAYNTDLLQSYEPYKVISCDAEHAVKFHTRSAFGGMRKRKVLATPLNT